MIFYCISFEFVPNATSDPEPFAPAPVYEDHAEPIVCRFVPPERDARRPVDWQRMRRGRVIRPRQRSPPR